MRVCRCIYKYVFHICLYTRVQYEELYESSTDIYISYSFLSFL